MLVLYEQPFTNYSPLGLDGLFSEPEAADIVNILAMVNKNAGWAGAGGGGLRQSPRQLHA